MAKKKQIKKKKTVKKSECKIQRYLKPCSVSDLPTHEDNVENIKAWMKVFIKQKRLDKDQIRSINMMEKSKLICQNISVESHTKNQMSPHKVCYTIILHFENKNKSVELDLKLEF